MLAIDSKHPEVDIKYSCSCHSQLLSSVVRAFHRHREGLSSSLGGGPIVKYGFCSTVPGLNFNMCMILTRD